MNSLVMFDESATGLTATQVATMYDLDPCNPTVYFWNTELEVKKPGYWESLVRHCKRHDIKVIYASRLIELGRGSISSLLTTMAALSQLGVDINIYSLKLTQESTVLLSLLKWQNECKRIAQLESLARARTEGGRIGRPPKEIDIHRLRRLLAEGKSLRDIADITGLSHTTVMRRLGAADPKQIPQTSGED